MIPDGYRLYKEDKDHIKVAVVNFALMGQECPETIEHDGKEYKRGMMDVIPSNLVGHACSMRIYDLVA